MHQEMPNTCVWCDWETTLRMNFDNFAATAISLIGIKSPIGSSVIWKKMRLTIYWIFIEVSWSFVHLGESSYEGINWVQRPLSSSNSCPCFGLTENFECEDVMNYYFVHLPSFDIIQFCFVLSPLHMLWINISFISHPSTLFNLASFFPLFINLNIFIFHLFFFFRPLFSASFLSSSSFPCFPFPLLPFSSSSFFFAFLFLSSHFFSRTLTSSFILIFIDLDFYFHLSLSLSLLPLLSAPFLLLLFLPSHFFSRTLASSSFLIFINLNFCIHLSHLTSSSLCSLSNSSLSLSLALSLSTSLSFFFSLSLSSLLDLLNLLNLTILLSTQHPVDAYDIILADFTIRGTPKTWADWGATSYSSSRCARNTNLRCAIMWISIFLIHNLASYSQKTSYARKLWIHINPSINAQDFGRRNGKNYTDGKNLHQFLPNSIRKKNEETSLNMFSFGGVKLCLGSVLLFYFWNRIPP